MSVSTTAGPKIERTVRILSTQAWIAPGDVSQVEVILCGGGGGGAGSGGLGPGWGGGGSVFWNILTVVPSTSYTITIGGGGAGGPATTGGGLSSAGTSTTFGALMTATGGGAAQADTGSSNLAKGAGSGLGGNGGWPRTGQSATYGSNGFMVQPQRGMYGFGASGAGAGNADGVAISQVGGAQPGLHGSGGSPNNGQVGLAALANTGAGGGASGAPQAANAAGGSGGSGIAIIKYWSAF